VLDRRRFLAIAGAALAAPVVVWLGADALLDDAGTRAGRPAGAPPRYPPAPSARDLLARRGSSLVVPTGTFTTSYEQDAPADDTTWDLRGARFVGYFDADALYETGEFATGSTKAQKNNHPIRLGRDAPVSGAALIGGVVEGAQPATLTWERMKYGQHVQDDTDRWIDAGRPSDVDPHRNQIDNRNQDGDPRVYIRPRAWAVWDGVRVRNTHDGIGLYGDFPSGPGICYIRNCWLRDIHDDAIENDDWHELHVMDTLVEGTYTFLSCQNHGLDGARPDHEITVENSVVRLRPYPGGYKTRSTDSVHGQIYKAQDNAPGLFLRNVVIASERFRDPSGDGPRLPERRGRIVDHYEDVTLVWLGPGAYPGNVPAGCRLSTDPGVYEDAVTEWKARHGVADPGSGDMDTVDMDTVDMDRMLDPVPAAP
jgi:hypothetical protein